MKTNESFAQMLKMEIMERYGLREDQVRLELSIYTEDLDLGCEILGDFDTETWKDAYLGDSKPCDNVKGKDIDQVWVHRRDGFYGSYVVGDDSDE